MSKKRANAEQRGANGKVSAEAAVRQRDAMRLRRGGQSYRDIAEAIGVSVATAYKYVADAYAELAAECTEDAVHARQIELDRLDDALTKVEASEGYGKGEPPSITAWMRLGESRRKLLGLDMPAKVDVTSDGDKVQFVVSLPSEQETDGRAS